MTTNKLRKATAGLWEGTKSVAQSLFGPPTEEQRQSMTEDQAEQYTQAKKDVWSDVINQMTDAATQGEKAKRKKQQGILDYLNTPVNFSDVRMVSAPYEPTNVKKIPDVKFTPITKLTGAGANKTFTSGKRNPLIDASSWGETMQRVSYGLTPGMGDDPIVVQEGMAERDASTFGVFSAGSKNRVGLLKRRTDSQAEAARLLGDRG